MKEGELGVCWLQEFQVVLGSPKCQEVPWQVWVKETKNLLEGSPLRDRTECIAGYASWGVWRIWRCGLQWGGKNLTHWSNSIQLGSWGPLSRSIYCQQAVASESKTAQVAGFWSMWVECVLPEWMVCDNYAFEAVACHEAALCPW